MTEADIALAKMFEGPKFLGLPDCQAAPPSYAEPLSETAIQIGQERLCADCTEVADFIGGSEDVREPSDAFGPISVPELVAQLLRLPKTAGEANAVLMAARELRRRLVEDKSEYVLRVAMGASQA